MGGLVLAACAGPAVPAGPLDGGASPEEPAAPATPELGECRSGTLVAHEHGPPTCEPWPLGARPACGPAEAPTATGCQPIGRACGSPRPPHPAGRVVLHVDPSAAPGGDGSERAPLARIADALAVRSSAVTIVLAPGEHDGDVVLGDDVTLEGACAAQTSVVHRDPEADAIVYVEGTSVVLRDLRVSGAATAGVYGAPGSSLELRGIAVDRAERYGIACLTCELIAEDVLVRDIVGRPSSTSPAVGGYGFTLEVARATLERITVERATEIGILVAASAEPAVLRDVSILDVAPGPSGSMGVGLGVSIGGEADVAGLFVEGAARAGVIVERSSRAVIRDARIRGVSGVTGGDRPRGQALSVASESEVEVERLVVASTVAGVEVDGASSAALRDLRLDDLRGVEPHGAWGFALRAVGGSSLTASRAHVERVADLAIVAHEESRIEVSDLRVRGVAGSFDPALGVGQASGMALLVRGGAHATIRRAELDETSFVAIGATENEQTLAELEDVRVRDVAPGPFGGLAGGRGIVVVLGARVIGRRVSIERAREVALSAWAFGRAEIEDLTIAETQPRDDGRAGIGAGAYGGGHLGLTRFVIASSPLCGIQLAHGASLPEPGAPSNEIGGTATLRAGRVVRAPIGVNVQVEDAALDTLVSDLTFVDVERRLAADALPVPAPDPGEVLRP